MKRLVVNAGEIAMSFSHGNVEDIYETGTYWVGFRKEIKMYSLLHSFTPPVALELLKKNEDFLRLAKIIDVNDNEICLHYRNGKFQSILRAGEYVFWNGINEDTFQKIDFTNYEIGDSISDEIISKYEFASFVKRFDIQPYEKGILLVNSKFEKWLDPGFYRFWKNATKIEVLKVDLREKQLEVVGQEILTQDKANLRINFVMNFKVEDVYKVTFEIKDYEKQLYLMGQMLLRNVVSEHSFDKLLEDKNEIADAVFNEFKEKAKSIGVKLISCGIKDIILPGDIKEIMNQVLVAQKKAQANVIMRREETASTRSLLNTAKLMENNEMLLKLKEMEYVEKITEKVETISLSGGTQIAEQLKNLFVK
ncbi:slipin family protein [Aureivirga sp. CE67]|uniref:slipin family protein n=1 Tax=Aureivirga sp. CE67 TaxID=1788983 RepID=UPI0018CA0B52|nr:slipin family protein [Aureivirga sp. CE67]